MFIVILGVDLGKNVCSVVGVDAAGAAVVRKSIRRQTLIDYVTKLPACVVAMEACCGAHNPGRIFAAQGHEIKVMSPEYVRPYVKAQKTITVMPRGSLMLPRARRCASSNLRPKSSWTSGPSTASDQDWSRSVET